MNELQMRAVDLIMRMTDAQIREVLRRMNEEAALDATNIQDGKAESI